MKRLTLEAPMEQGLLAQLFGEEGGILGTPGWGEVAVLRLEDYRVLRAVAALVGEPTRLLETLRENKRFQQGEEGEVVTFDHIFNDHDELKVSWG